MAGRDPEGIYGDGSRPTASSFDNPDHSPANLSLSHANMQPSSPARRPIPNNAFQTIHFKFQSNLNRALVSNHITIIVSEEENQIHPLPVSLRNPLRATRQQLTMGSSEKVLVDQPCHIDSPRITLPHVGNVPDEGDGTLNDSNHPISIPEEDKAGNEVLCLASDRLAKEKTPGGGKED